MVDLMLSDAADAPKGVKAALARLNGDAPEPARSKFSEFMALWGRMNTAERREVWEYVAEKRR